MLDTHSFVFGVSISAVQTEENPQNDWKGLTAHDGSVMNKNIEHLARWKDDYALVKDLGVDVFRTSVDWARLQPAPFAPLDPAAAASYHRMFSFLKENGIALVLTLHHFANPVWFDDMGGWEKRKNIGAFLDFAEKAVAEFGRYASHVITINEITTYVSLTEIEAFLHPKKKNSVIGSYRTIRAMAQAHREAYRALKERHPDLQIGFSEVARPTASKNGRVDELIVAAIGGFVANTYIWNRLMPQADFIGINYYGTLAFDFTKKTDPVGYRKGKEHDDLFEMNPELLVPLAERLHKKYGGLPVYIIENGTCTDDDMLRRKNLIAHLDAIFEARKKGDTFIKGYIHWSILDNFELNRGMSYHYGLVAVDPLTMERKPKESYYLYQNEIQKRRSSSRESNLQKNNPGTIEG